MYWITLTQAQHPALGLVELDCIRHFIRWKPFVFENESNSVWTFGLGMLSILLLLLVSKSELNEYTKTCYGSDKKCKLCSGGSGGNSMTCVMQKGRADNLNFSFCP